MKLCSSGLFAVFLLAGSIPPAKKATAPPPITVDDLFGVKEAHEAQISPDGQVIALAVIVTSVKEDKPESGIWMVPTAGGDAIPLTAEGVASSHARWSPDGKYLPFLSTRKDAEGNDEKTQVYLLNRQGGEAQRLTDTIQDVEEFEWAPDGKQLVLILRDPTPEELEAAARKTKGSDDGAGKKSKAQPPWVIDRLQFKNDNVGYIDRRRTHLYVFNMAAKTQRQGTSGYYEDSHPGWGPGR